MYVAFVCLSWMDWCRSVCICFSACTRLLVFLVISVTKIASSGLFREEGQKSFILYGLNYSVTPSSAAGCNKSTRLLPFWRGLSAAWVSLLGGKKLRGENEWIPKGSSVHIFLLPSPPIHISACDSKGGGAFRSLCWFTFISMPWAGFYAKTHLFLSTMIT